MYSYGPYISNYVFFRFELGILSFYSLLIFLNNPMYFAIFYGRPVEVSLPLPTFLPRKIKQKSLCILKINIKVGFTPLISLTICTLGLFSI